VRYPAGRGYRRSYRRPDPAADLGCAFLAFWAFCALLSVTTSVVVLWALIRLVLHFT
jgi:hypothetical protein